MLRYLVVDESEESKQACELLDSHGFDYEKLERPWAKGPSLYAQEGGFHHIDGIKIYVAIAKPPKSELRKVLDKLGSIFDVSDGSGIAQLKCL